MTGQTSRRPPQEINLAPSEAQLLSQLKLRAGRYSRAHLFGFYSSPGYEGANVLEAAGHKFQVVDVLSPIHFCELANRSEAGEHIVALCPERSWVLQDVEDRLAGGELKELDIWEAVLGLFQVPNLEPGLRRNADLAGWLLEAVPPQGYPPAPGLLLTEEFCWSVLLKERLGLDPDCHDSVNFLAWASGQGEVNRVRSAPLALVQEAGQWLSRRGSPLGAILLEQLRRLEPLDLLVLGLVCEVIFLAPSGDEQLKACTRFEVFLEWPDFQPEMGRSWADSTRRFLHGLPEQPTWWDVILERARGYLGKFKASSLATSSRLLPEGFDAHLESASQAIRSNGAQLVNHLQELERHFIAEKRSQTLGRIATAGKLLRYLSHPEPASPQNFSEAFQLYHDDHAWADRALQGLSSPEPHPALRQALQELSQRVLQHRQRFDHLFALQLTTWNNQTGAEKAPIPVEKVLERLVAPLAEKKRIFLLVLDGCSWPVLQELLDDLSRKNLHPYLPTDAAQMQVVAGVPSVTEVSRCSLLSGKIEIGNADTEKENFRRHPSLVSVCRKDYPPQLYHKADLGKEQIYARLASEDYKVIGAVINTIDDTLSKDEQLNLNWNSTLVKPLENLLVAASKAQRLVLIVSDHGHILEQGTIERPSSGAGNRWQPGPPQDDGTVLLQGGRLHHADSARLAWRHDVRYGPKKRGYHGGSSPQEMVCSLALVAQSGQKIDGWQEGQLQPPAWWWEPQSQTPWMPARSQEDLFGQLPSLPELLRKSPNFEWKQKVYQSPPTGWEPLLDYLARHPKGVSPSQLAAELGLSEPQAYERIQGCQRWFRVEGVDVIELRRDRVVLVVDKLEGLYQLR